MKRNYFNPFGFSKGAMAIAAFACYKTDAELTEEEKLAEKALLDKVKEQTEKQLKAFSASLVEKKSFDLWEEKFKTLEEKSKDPKTATEFKSIVEDFGKLTLEVKALKEISVGEDRGVKKGSIVELMNKNKAKLDSFISNKSGSLQLEYKTSLTETSTDISNRDAFFTWHEGGKVGRLPVRRPFMRELFKNVSTNTEYIKYIDQATIARTAQNVALCGAINTTTKVTFAVNTLHVDKVKDLNNVCLDMLNDYAFVQGEIQELLNSSLALKIDNDLLLGTGASPILHGVAEYASTFDAALVGADYALSVPNAQLIDLLSVAGAQIRALGQENMYFPDTITLNPRDAQGIKYLKDQVANYAKTPMLIPSLFQDQNGRMYIDGMLVVSNPLVPQNEAYIFDSQKGTVYSRPGVGIEFAYENGTNFETDTVTLKVYERLNLLIRNVDANAFMHIPDLAAGIAAINQSGVS